MICTTDSLVLENWAVENMEKTMYFEPEDLNPGSAISERVIFGSQCLHL